MDNLGMSGAIIAGGMEPGQVVSNKTYFVQIGIIWGTSNLSTLDIQCFPNPNSGVVFFEPFGEYEVQLSTLDGHLISTGKVFSGDSFVLPELSTGVYFLRIMDQEGKYKLEKLVIR